MQVQIDDIKAKLTEVLERKGCNAADIPFIIDMYLGGELRGHTSHGLASFPGFAKEDFSNLPQPEVVKSTASLFMLDAKSHSGNVLGRRAADEAIKRAQKEVAGMAIIKNMDSWLRPGGVAEYITRQGYFAIVINNGGGASIAPPGGYDPVLGTNPIAYGIPTADEPLVVDIATSKHAWGQVRLANKYGTELPADTFYDDQGNITRDPKQVHSVLPAGDYKGFALALMIEILCGSLIGMNRMMINTKNAGSNFGARLLDRGGFILVIDPKQTTDENTFKHANSDLLERIKNTHALEGQEIRIPGEQASALKAERLRSGFIDIPEELWQEIQVL